MRLTVYHGTFHAFDRFEKTRDVGFHFGCHRQARRRLDLSYTEDQETRRSARTGTARIIQAEIEFDEPLITLDDPMRWDGFHVLTMMRPRIGESRFAAARDFYLAKTAEGAKEGEFMPALVRKAVESCGYDAVVYRNVYEGSSKNARGATDWSYVVMDPARIRILDPDFRGKPDPVATPDRVVDREAAVANWQNKRCSLRFNSSKAAFEAACRRVLDGFDRHSVSLDKPLDRDAVFYGEWQLKGSAELAGMPFDVMADMKWGWMQFNLRKDFESVPSRMADDSNPTHYGKAVDVSRGGRFSWQGTETADEFVSRVSSIVRGFRMDIEAVAAPTMRMAG